jgi:hypothetical protein
VFWVVLSRIWAPWRRALHLVNADTSGLATEGLQNVLGQSFATKEWRSPASEFREYSGRRRYLYEDSTLVVFQTH